MQFATILLHLLKTHILSQRTKSKKVDKKTLKPIRLDVVTEPIDMFRAAVTIMAISVSGSVFAAEKTTVDKAGAQIVSYDNKTNAKEVFDTIQRLVSEDAKNKSTRVIYIVSGTHGTASGTVDASCKEIAFKDEDLKSAGITRTNINVRDYTLTSSNKWAELNGKGKNNVIVLGFCYSLQWLSNTSADGNNGKIVLK